MNHTIGFQEKTTIEKLAKVVVMTSTPGPTWMQAMVWRGFPLAAASSCPELKHILLAEASFL
jgi:hypothetical protein